MYFCDTLTQVREYNLSSSYNLVLKNVVYTLHFQGIWYILHMMGLLVKMFDCVRIMSSDLQTFSNWIKKFHNKLILSNVVFHFEKFQHFKVFYIKIFRAAAAGVCLIWKQMRELKPTSTKCIFSLFLLHSVQYAAILWILSHYFRDPGFCLCLISSFLGPFIFEPFN